MTSPEPETNACCKLAELAEEVAARNVKPREFIYALGEKAAGIRPGLWRYFDLLKGGRTLMLGQGFRPELDDGSGGHKDHDRLHTSMVAPNSTLARQLQVY